MKNLSALYTIDEMLDNKNIHLLDIVTQMHGHQNLAAIAAERQLACIVQKPFAPTRKMCEHIRKVRKT